jgi:hypothetical protein
MSSGKSGIRISGFGSGIRDYCASAKWESWRVGVVGSRSVGVGAGVRVRVGA